MHDAWLAAICFAAVVGIPVTAVVITRENKRLFESFTRYLENRPATVGGETENLARARIDLDLAKLDLERDKIDAHRFAAQLDAETRAARLGIVRGGPDRIESA